MVDDYRAIAQISPPSTRNVSPRSITPSPAAPKRNPFKIIAYVLVFLGSMGFIVYYARNLLNFLESIKELGLLGNLIFIVSYLPCGLPFALISYYIPLSLSAGFLYGIYRGMATLMIGSVSSGMFGFWVTRKFCMSWIEDKIKSNARLSALLLAMEVHSFKITLMLRFLPLPFGLQNGLCAVTSITSPMFLLASAIGLLPENMVLIYFGSSIESLPELARGDFGHISIYEKVFFVVAIVIVIIMVLVGRKIFAAALVMARSSNKKEDSVELTYLNDAPENENIEEGMSETRKFTADEANAKNESEYEYPDSPPIQFADQKTPLKLNKLT